jgi:hypothetical protein
MFGISLAFLWSKVKWYCVISLGVLFLLGGVYWKAYRSCQTHQALQQANETINRLDQREQVRTRYETRIKTLPLPPSDPTRDECYSRLLSSKRPLEEQCNR